MDNYLVFLRGDYKSKYNFVETLRKFTIAKLSIRKLGSSSSSSFDVRYKFAMHLYRTRFSSFCFDLEHALKLIHAFVNQYNLIIMPFIFKMRQDNEEKKSLSNLAQTTGFNCRGYVQGRVQIRSVNS